MKKLSAMHLRVMNKSRRPVVNDINSMVISRRGGVSATSGVHKPVYNGKVKPGFYVACMGEDNARTMNHTDAAVISIRLPGASTIEFPDAEAVLELRADLEDSRSLDQLSQEKLAEFIKNNLTKVKKVHVHCTYGEIRSRSVAMGIAESLNIGRETEVHAYSYTSVRGFLEIPTSTHAPHQGLFYAGFKATRAASDVEGNGIDQHLIDLKDYDLSP